MNNNNIDKQEQIDRFLSGEMDKEEKTAFEQQMENDQELREEVELSRHIIHAFRYEGEQKAIDAIRSIPEDALEKLTASLGTKGKKKKHSLIIWMSVAAAAAVVCILLYIETRPQYTTYDLYARYYATQPYETYPSRGGDELTIEEKKKIQQARKLYEQKEYAQALAIYNQLLTGKPDPKSLPEEIHFYTAISRFETGDPDGAIEELTRLASSAQSDFQDEALWNLAFIYLKDNQRGKAKDCLQQLIEKDNDYTDKAKDIMDLLNKKRWF